MKKGQIYILAVIFITIAIVSIVEAGVRTSAPTDARLSPLIPNTMILNNMNSQLIDVIELNPTDYTTIDNFLSIMSEEGEDRNLEVNTTRTSAAAANCDVTITTATNADDYLTYVKDNYNNIISYSSIRVCYP